MNMDDFENMRSKRTEIGINNNNYQKIDFK